MNLKVFWASKLRTSDKGNLLNSSIDNISLISLHAQSSYLETLDSSLSVPKKCFDNFIRLWSFTSFLFYL